MKHILKEEFDKLPGNVRDPLVDRFSSHLKQMISRYNHRMRDPEVRITVDEVLGPLSSIVNLAKDMKENNKKNT